MPIGWHEIPPRSAWAGRKTGAEPGRDRPVIRAAVALAPVPGEPIRIAWRAGPPGGAWDCRPLATPTAIPWRKAILPMTTHTRGGPRRLRAALIGFGLDDHDEHHRIITGAQYLLV